MLKALNLPPQEWTDALREYILASHTDALVVWVPDLLAQESTQGRIDESQWAVPDEMIHWGVANGLKVVMCMGSNVPKWAYVANERRAGHPPESGQWNACYPPDDLTTRGPWAQALARCLRRHPHTYACIVGNEPNLAWGDYPWQPQACARTLHTAAQIAKNHGYQRLWAWGVADGWSAYGSAARFLDLTLQELNKFKPWWLRHWRPPRGVTVGVAWHPYSDVATGTTTRAQAALKVLAARFYRGPQILLSEGGYQYALKPPPGGYTDRTGDEQRQLQYVSAHVRWARASGHVGCWAQYSYHDAPVNWASGLVGYDDVPHPLHAVWSTL